MLCVVNGEKFATTVWICLAWILWKLRNKVLLRMKSDILKKLLTKLKPDCRVGVSRKTPTSITSLFRARILDPFYSSIVSLDVILYDRIYKVLHVPKY